MKEAINIKNLTKNYKKSGGINNINLKIERGTTYGFIGPNGAGKSTTIKCIMNFIRKNAGEIYIEGKEINNQNDKIKEKIGYLPSEIHLYEDLTVKKMLEYSASFYKKDCTKKMQELIKKLEIDTSKKIDQLSLGNLKKVGIVLALMHDPDIIIMDEATSGLDPLMQEAFYEILEDEKKKGKTIFFSSHILSEVKRICDKVAIIKKGEIIKINDIKSMEDDNFVKVKIQSKEIEKIKKDLKIEVRASNEEIEFIYKENINELLQTLSKYNLDKLYIQELDLEEVFLHYYQ